jgi:hypothetical protein
MSLGTQFPQFSDLPISTLLSPSMHCLLPFLSKPCVSQGSSHSHSTSTSSTSMTLESLQADPGKG